MKREEERSRFISVKTEKLTGTVTHWDTELCLHASGF